MTFRRGVLLLSLLDGLVPLLAVVAAWVWLDSLWGPLVASLVALPAGGWGYVLYRQRREGGAGAWLLWPWSLLSRDLGAVADALRAQRLTAAGRYREAAALADAAAASTTQRWAHALGWQVAAVALLETGDSDGAVLRLDGAEAEFRATGDLVGMLTCLNARGALLSRRLQLPEAEALFGEVLRQAQGVRRARILGAAAQYNLGWVAYQRGQLEQAFRWWSQVSRPHGPHVSGWVRLGLARLALRLGDASAARGMLPERGPWRVNEKLAVTRRLVLAAADRVEGRPAPIPEGPEVDEVLEVDPWLREVLSDKSLKGGASPSPT